MGILLVPGVSPVGRPTVRDVRPGVDRKSLISGRQVGKYGKFENNGSSRYNHIAWDIFRGARLRGIWQDSQLVTVNLASLAVHLLDLVRFGNRLTMRASYLIYQRWLFDCMQLACCHGLMGAGSSWGIGRTSCSVSRTTVHFASLQEKFDMNRVGSGCVGNTRYSVC